METAAGASPLPVYGREWDEFGFGIGEGIQDVVGKDPGLLQQHLELLPEEGNHLGIFAHERTEVV